MFNDSSLYIDVLPHVLLLIGILIFIRYKNKFKNLSLFSFFVFSLYIIQDKGFYQSDTLELIHLVLLIISLFSLFINNDRGFSLYSVFHIFVILFIVLSPISQFKNGIVFWGASNLQELDYIKTSLFLLILIVVVNLSYWKTKKRKQIALNNFLFKLFTKHKIKTNLTVRDKIIILGISLGSLILLLYQNNFSFLSLLLRGGEYKQNADNGQIAWLIINNFVMPMNAILLMVTIRSRNSRCLVFFLMIMTLLSSSPTSLSRFAVAAIYIPILAYFPLFKKYFVSILILGILFIFPFLSVFRSYGANQNLKLNFNAEMFSTPDFDSYFSFAEVLKYNIISYGDQILGVVFFWIPRSLWIDKPKGSGAFIAEKLDFFCSNISCNFLAEGYVNFGIIGSILFAILLGYMMAKFDVCFYESDKSKIDNIESYNIAYYIMIGMLMFVLRGDLLSSTAYLCGFLCSYKLLLKVLSTHKK